MLLVSSIRAYSQSNKGTEFWTAYMAHVNGAVGNNGSKMVLYITSDVSTTGSVEIAGNLLQTYNVTANQVTIISIPSSAYLSGQGKSSQGIHILSAKPIAVYAHIYAMSVSGATLLLPVNTMGKDYISLNYTQRSNYNGSNSDFAVIATEDNTTVSITPSATLIGGEAAGVAFNITLQKGEVYQGMSPTDLTGTKIQSISTAGGACKKIAVFSGSTKIGIGCSTAVLNNESSDNLFQQVYPTSTWGKNYVTAPLANRPYDIYRIVLSDPATTVTLNGATLSAANFTGGLYYEFNSQTTNVISADKPIQVVQYSATQGQNLNCTGQGGDVGDPEMIYLSPIEQGLDHVTLYSSGYYKITQSYINVVIPTTAVSSFTLDGVAYTNFTPVVGNPAYSYAQIQVTSGPQEQGGGSVGSGTHTIKASAAFNAIAYGFGNAESYGYAAGTNLLDLNEYVAFQNPVKRDTILTSGCSNSLYTLQVTIPYTTNIISWNLQDGNAPHVFNNPTPDTTIIKGNQTLYVYRYPTPVNYTAGDHKVVATVLNPNSAALCGSNEDIEFDFTISDPAGADFKVNPNNCFGDSTAFVDNTPVPAGNTIKKWLWDFGDGSTSALKNPSHLYSATGNYTVHLTVTDNNSCIGVSGAKSVHIKAKPVAGFTFSTPDCGGQNVTFTNTSTSAEGNINKWLWDFGDGTISDIATGVPITHIYANTGPYTVKLTVTTDSSCISNVYSQALTVNPTPVVDFVLPDVCLNDAFAQFTDKSTIEDNSEALFTYAWNFGDGNSTPVNNVSILKNPQHKYSQVGVYTVTLTVTSKNGCVSTRQQQFTVNGSIPLANFNPENLCSGDDIVFDDLSTVDFGSVTKVVWYFDYDNQPGVTETYITGTMPANKKYTHNYGLFNTPASKTFNVRMDAYSGVTCVNTTYKLVTINANPVITLEYNNGPIVNLVAPITLCQADVPVQIQENKGIYSGNGVFTGTGISSTGLFDPSVSGPGVFTINYLFTAATTGCTYATSFQITVNPTATVSLPAELTVLEGGQVTLRSIASISSGNFTYKWTPAASLNQDDIASPIASPTDNTLYKLTVTSDKGCAAVAQVLVKVLKAPLVPNAFTPNNDGINDTWAIKYLDEYPNCTVEIFSRYGERVFYSAGYTVNWDGRYKGADLPVGTYYYIIDPKSGRKPISGYITIIR